MVELELRTEAPTCEGLEGLQVAPLKSLIALAQELNLLAHHHGVCELGGVVAGRASGLWSGMWIR